MHRCCGTASKTWPSQVAAPPAAASATGLAASSAVAIGLAAGASGTIGSVVGQEIASGSVDWSSAFSSGVVSGLTAGLTQAFVGSTGMSTLSNGTVQANAAVTLANLPTTATRIAEQSVIGATVKTVIQGGSFGTALLNDVVNSAAAVGANAIGDAQVNGVFGTGVAGEATYLAVHATLGCAASAAEGTGCGGGAIGGAVSAVVAPSIRDALSANTQTVTTVANADGSTTQITSYNNANINAVTTAIAALAGGAAAGILGQNSTAGVTWAANEAINNATSTKNVDYAAQMLGYDRQTFGSMVHDMKAGLGLGGADNVIWHSDGSIEFKGKIIGNMHDY